MCVCVCSVHIWTQTHTHTHIKLNSIIMMLLVFFCIILLLLVMMLLPLPFPLDADLFVDGIFFGVIPFYWVPYITNHDGYSFCVDQLTSLHIPPHTHSHTHIHAFIYMHSYTHTFAFIFVFICFIFHPCHSELNKWPIINKMNDRNWVIPWYRRSCISSLQNTKIEHAIHLRHSV